MVIKLVRQDTDKYQILSFLHNQQPQTLETHCIISVLDLLECESHYGFAVMPRWGDSIFTPSFQKLSDVVDFVHSALKVTFISLSLSFAHIFERRSCSFTTTTLLTGFEGLFSLSLSLLTLTPSHFRTYTPTTFSSTIFATH